MKYRVTTIVGITAFTDVEADNEEQAKEIAAERGLMTARANMGGEADYEFVIEEFDSEIDLDKVEITKL